MQLIFYRPIYLWFLLLIPLLVAVHLYSMNYVRRKALMFANYSAIERITGGVLLPKNYSLLLLRIICITLFVLVAAGITLVYSVQSSQFDTVIAIDTSSSMNLNDLSPSRIQAAKDNVVGFIHSLTPGSQVGIVSFSTTAGVLSRLGGDLDASVQAVQAIQPRSTGGTAIGDAVIAATNELENSKRKKAVLLITDGENNAGSTPQQAAEYAKNHNVVIFAIGVGSIGSNITADNELYAPVDEKTLREITANTSGAYYNANDNLGFKLALKDIASRQGVREEESDFTIQLMTIAFLLVFIDWGLSSSKYRIIP